VSGDWPTGGWRRTTPEAAGLNAAPLAALDREFAAGTVPLVDDFLVARGGAIVFERHYAHDYATLYHAQARTPGPLNATLAGPYNYFDPAWHPYVGGSDAHTLQSISKSVTSATLGIAMGRGDFRASLETPVLGWFERSRVRHVDARKERMTLRHVLTMTTGLDWNEEVAYDDPRNGASRMEATRDWVQFVIDQPMAHEPGTTFAYSSGATELLAHAFEREAGLDVEEYARERLFAPLGIRHHYWKRTPLGVVDTQGGLYLAAADLAKIGLLYLRRGNWDGARILAADWIGDSLAPHVDARDGWRYGFQWWLVPDGRGRFAWTALGIGGQHLFVLPDDDLVVVLTGWRILDETRYAEPLLRKIVAALAG
jgi:CubicO group peptidase (beta-lactamase class C family)